MVREVGGIELVVEVSKVEEDGGIAKAPGFCCKKEARSRDIEIKKRKRENQSLLDGMAYAKCMPCK
jgi:hypothetical protein